MMRLCWFIVLIAWAEAHALQAPTERDKVEVEPVTCWWRTSAAAVRVGESFDVVLTCSLLQTEAARAIADESRLEPSVVQLPPFEVIGGARAKDVMTATRRFVQVEYRLRAIAENVFAAQVAVPPLEISYRVEARVSGGEALAGRDLTYALPPLTMRVLSLVPDTAGDIREAPIATFAEIESGDARGTMYRVAAGIAFVLGALMLVIAIAGAVRGRRASRHMPPRTLAAAAVLTRVRRELAEIQDEVRASAWTSDLAGRALAAVRIVAAYATGRPVTQRPTVIDSTQTSGGEIVITRRAGAAAAVSAAVATVEDDELRDALARFSAAQYGREEIFDTRLDEALAAVVLRTDRLIAERPWREKLWAP